MNIAGRDAARGEKLTERGNRVVEYRFGDVLGFIAPFVGVSGTSDSAFYGYGGFGFDINFGPEWVLTPNGAAGYFARGRGTNLGPFMGPPTGKSIRVELAEFWRFEADQVAEYKVIYDQAGFLAQLGVGV